MLAMTTGQITEAEQMLQAAIKRWPGADAPALLNGLQVVYHLEGRTEDVRRAIIASWAQTDTPAEVVRHLSRIDNAPLAIAMIRETLDKAAENDDRGWLAQANLAIRTGQFDRATKWLDACAAPTRRRGCLACAARAAQAQSDVKGVWHALERLPVDALSPTELLRLRAWLASLTGELEVERAALCSLIEREPGETAALDRLTSIAELGHRTSEVARLRAKKSELLDAQTRYRALLHGDSIGDPAELARLAKALGRAIEARGWALIRDGKVGPPGPSRPALVPLEVTDGSEPRSTGISLAELCNDLRREHGKEQATGPPEVVPRFVDDAEPAGLRFVHENGASALKRLPETMSGGVGLLDYDGDGWLDVYVVQSGPFPPDDHPSCDDRLYRNRGDGTEDATMRSRPGR